MFSELSVILILFSELSVICLKQFHKKKFRYEPEQSFSEARGCVCVCHLYLLWSTDVGQSFSSINNLGSETSRTKKKDIIFSPCRHSLQG